MADEQQNPATAEANWQYQGVDDQHAGSNMAESTGVPLQQIPAVQWSASEYVSHEKSTGWYAALFGATIVIVTVVYAITRDVLASVVVFLASGAMSVYAGRKPGTKNYIIDENGVKIDENFHGYSEFRSFSVVEEGAIDSVWLKPIKRFSPMVVMYFGPEDEQEIVDVLANFLPHEERELDAIDRFSKRIRF